MTASREQDQAAATAQQQGEAFAAAWAATSERQSEQTSGSDVEVSQADLHPGPAGVTPWPSS